MNIENLTIGQVLYKDKHPYTITDKTGSSLRLFTNARKKSGIKSNDWYSLDQLKSFSEKC